MKISISTTEDITGRVTLILANNFVMKYWLKMALEHNFFTSLHIFNTHAMLINAYTKGFTLTINAFLSYGIEFEHLLRILQDGCQYLLRY